jgi:hypothetical protein
VSTIDIRPHSNDPVDNEYRPTDNNKVSKNIIHLDPDLTSNNSIMNGLPFVEEFREKALTKKLSVKNFFLYTSSLLHDIIVRGMTGKKCELAA